MKKIPCLFERKFDKGKTFELLREVTPGCEWVLAGEGVATTKWDGTACLIRDGKLFARYDARGGKTPPAGFEPLGDPDKTTNHLPGWLLVADQPEYKWHREASREGLADGTYELCGPKVNGNNNGLGAHHLIRHGASVHEHAPRTFDGLKAFLRDLPHEGIVFHHPDGRMAKIRRADFGFPWGAVAERKARVRESIQPKEAKP